VGDLATLFADAVAIGRAARRFILCQSPFLRHPVNSREQRDGRCGSLSWLKFFFPSLGLRKVENANKI
jgi:hypothetical protein